jgi:hypothetical protein
VERAAKYGLVVGIHEKETRYHHSFEVMMEGDSYVVVPPL